MTLKDDDQTYALWCRAMDLMRDCEEAGVAITIERKPEQPLVMGNHVPVLTMWEKVQR
jgi:hypothetical protein